MDEQYKSNLTFDTPQQELTGNDYLSLPLSQLMNHPDFSPDALRAVTNISMMTTAQLEEIPWRRNNAS